MVTINIHVSCNVQKSFIVDVVTKLYIATDSNPVDAHMYELCSDLLDVVIDVSFIYGGNTAFDERSTSAVKMNNNGLILYLRQVSDYLALVCILNEDNFKKRTLVDYNIDIFRQSLSQLIKEETSR